MRSSLPDAVVATFRDPLEDGHAATLAAFSESAWMRHDHWMDASGLALYFLDRLKCLRLETCIPPVILRRLEEKLRDNGQRSADSFAEYVRLNRTFVAANAEYVNVKGVSLVPHACKDASLRVQLDLDFVVTSRTAKLCDQVLSSAGYVLTGVGTNVWEYKTNADRVPSRKDLYKPSSQRCVEIHIVQALPPNCTRQVLDELCVPVLEDIEGFLGQAMHIEKHLHSEWSRLSWLLEFRNSVKYRGASPDFWERVDEATLMRPGALAALGVAMALTRIAFGTFAPRDWEVRAVSAVDGRMRLWLEHFGRRVVMADFPGTKLYLLQPQLPRFTRRDGWRQRRLRLLPIHRPPRVAHASTTESTATRVRRWAANASYIAFRLRFHITRRRPLHARGSSLEAGACGDRTLRR